MRAFTLTVFSLLLFTSLNAQTITISGKIVDSETANPLAYAKIQLEETGIGTISQLSGEFSLKIPVKYVDKCCWFHLWDIKQQKCLPLTSMESGKQ